MLYDPGRARWWALRLLAFSLVPLALAGAVSAHPPHGQGCENCDVPKPTDEPPKWHPWRLREWPGKQPIGRGGPPHTFERAGWPDHLSPRAIPTRTPNYVGYYVGGGCVPPREGGRWCGLCNLFGGRKDRGAPPVGSHCYGTWGYDYGGLPGLRARVALWFCPWRYQGGTSGYATDGPHQPADVVPTLVERFYGGLKIFEREEEHEEEHEEHHE